jgi:hypothetical protein
VRLFLRSRLRIDAADIGFGIRIGSFFHALCLTSESKFKLSHRN